MAKVFRLHEIKGDNNIVDWQECTAYGTQAISEIKDPEGATAEKEITSIPSPFARIDLVKTAFHEVEKMSREGVEPLNGNTIYHKMVSEALDVAQIFFDFGKQKKNFEIIVWDRKKNLDKNSIFGKTLDRYLTSDAVKDAYGKEPYNFSKFNRMYLLNYKGPGKSGEMNIIGATSPATLFFSSANDLSCVTNNVNFGQDRPFDKSYKALFERDFEFVKYLYVFRKAYIGFNRDFTELDSYMTRCLNELSYEKQTAIDATDANSINDYSPIIIGEKGENTCEILGKTFHRKSDANIANWQSDFEIKSNVYNGKKPLVLPINEGNIYEDFIYTTDKWGKNTAPHFESTPWPNRTLPNEGTKYPYLTISDFLENNVISMPYELNNDSFYNGEYKDEDKKSFLLPLKNTFFEFFTVEELKNGIAGKKIFEFKPLPGGVKVILRIPIQKGFIEYSRSYFESSSLATDSEIENEHDGKMINKRIGLGIMPLIAFPEDAKKHYRIALFEKRRRDVSLTCYNEENRPITANAHIVRDEKDIALNECSKEAYVISDNFNRISVNVGNEIQGVIVPKFKKAYGNKVYTFAIDFGTTNSHIEYGFVTSAGTNPSDSDPFDISKDENQLHRLHTLYAADLDIEKAFTHNFIPETIGSKEDDFTFPMRTVFAEWNENNRNNTMYALANGNIPFLYEKEIFPERYNTARTELKWNGGDDGEDRLVKLYLDNIFMLLRNKVILNGGNLEDTKIIWFYPAGMTTARFNLFSDYWEKCYKEYFGDKTKNNLITISESAAPYRYYKRKKGASSEVVTIDIGGGTTDVYIVEDDEPKMLLSFLFASSAIFGDGGIGDETRWDSTSNGFVQQYYKEFEKILDNCNHSDLLGTLQQIEKHHKSTDIIAFLFSLIGNEKVNNNDALDFLSKLSKNNKLKYVFIVFYGSILYFIAKSMKAKGLKRPLTLAFSGNGSKTLRVLSTNTDTIGQFAKLIFDGVYGTEGNRLDIILEDEPKRATCKGGILNPNSEIPNDITKIKFTQVGNDMNAASPAKMEFKDITEDIQGQIVDSIDEFVEFLFDLHKKNDEFLTSSLGANESIVKQVKEICKDRTELSQSLKAALKHKQDDKKVEETLFFYPLIGVLHKLAREIVTKM